MTLPDVTMRILDNQLGLLPDGNNSLHVVLGVSSKGDENVLRAVSELNDLTDTYGDGPAVEAAGLSLNTPVNGVSGRPVLMMRIKASTAGVIGSVVKTTIDDSTGTVTVAQTSGTTGPYDRYDFSVTITRNGTVGVGAFTYSTDGITQSEEIAIPGGGTYDVPHTGLTLTFVPGAGPNYFETGDKHNFKTLSPNFTTSDLDDAVDAIIASETEFGFIHLVGGVRPALSAVTSSGTTPPVVTVSGTPIDFYHKITVDIVVGGARGTATFRISFDDGKTYSSTITTAATYVIPGTGITINFPTGTDYNADNVYTFGTGNAAGLRTLANTVAAHANAQEAVFQYCFWLMDAVDDTDTALATAFADFVNARVAIGGGYALDVSAIDTNQDKTSVGSFAAARCAAIPIGEDIARVASGAIQNMGTVFRDERVTPALDTARFCTVRTHRGKQGKFFTNGRTMAANGSDFSYLVYRRVMDVACRGSRRALLEFLVDNVPVNKNGTIQEVAARAIEAFVIAKLREELSDQVSDVGFQIIRTNNVLTEQKIKYKTRILPLGYARFIEGDIAFVSTIQSTGQQ